MVQDRVWILMRLGVVHSQGSAARVSIIAVISFVTISRSRTAFCFKDLVCFKLVPPRLNWDLSGAMARVSR